MKLISEQWIRYLHEKKDDVDAIEEKLFSMLYEYDLKRFTYEVEGGYRTPDTGLEDFPRYIFDFLVHPQNVITIQIDIKTTPMVRTPQQNIPFNLYYDLDNEKSKQFQAFFVTLGRELVKDSLA